MARTQTIALVAAIALAAAATVGGACGDDDGDEQEAAADLTATFENFRRDLLAVSDIGNAPDDVKGGLKDDCGELRDGVDSDALDDFCADLGEAIDDEDQAQFDRLKAGFATVETEFRDEIADRIADAADDNSNEGDDPLEGGDPGDEEDSDRDY